MCREGVFLEMSSARHMSASSVSLLRLCHSRMVFDKGNNKHRHSQRGIMRPRPALMRIFSGVIIHQEAGVYGQQCYIAETMRSLCMAACLFHPSGPEGVQAGVRSSQAPIPQVHWFIYQFIWEKYKNEIKTHHSGQIGTLKWKPGLKNSAHRWPTNDITYGSVQSLRNNEAQTSTM